MYDHLTTKEQLTERLQKLWVQATSSCGKATPQVLDEIREIEKRLDALDDTR
jgi:uncharacterized protein YoaH (UPF0181 family)